MDLREDESGLLLKKIVAVPTHHRQSTSSQYSAAADENSPRRSWQFIQGAAIPNSVARYSFGKPIEEEKKRDVTLPTYARGLDDVAVLEKTLAPKPKDGDMNEGDDDDLLVRIQNELRRKRLLDPEVNAEDYKKSDTQKEDRRVTMRTSKVPVLYVGRKSTADSIRRSIQESEVIQALIKENHLNEGYSVEPLTPPQLNEAREQATTLNESVHSDRKKRTTTKHIQNKEKLLAQVVESIERLPQDKEYSKDMKNEFASSIKKSDIKKKFNALLARTSKSLSKIKTDESEEEKLGTEQDTERTKTKYKRIRKAFLPESDDDQNDEFQISDISDHDLVYRENIKYMINRIRDEVKERVEELVGNIPDVDEEDSTMTNKMFKKLLEDELKHYSDVTPNLKPEPPPQDVLLEVKKEKQETKQAEETGKQETEQAEELKRYIKKIRTRVKKGKKSTDTQVNTTTVLEQRQPENTNTERRILDKNPAKNTSGQPKRHSTPPPLPYYDSEDIRNFAIARRIYEKTQEKGLPTTNLVARYAIDKAKQKQTKKKVYELNYSEKHHHKIHAVMK